MPGFLTCFCWGLSMSRHVWVFYPYFICSVAPASCQHKAHSRYSVGIQGTRGLMPSTVRAEISSSCWVAGCWSSGLLPMTPVLICLYTHDWCTGPSQRCTSASNPLVLNLLWPSPLLTRATQTNYSWNQPPLSILKLNFLDKYKNNTQEPMKRVFGGSCL